MFGKMNLQDPISMSDTCLPTKYEWPRPRSVPFKISEARLVRQNRDSYANCSRICCSQRTNVRNTGFYNLEPAILLLVFSHFTEKELLSKLSRVCRHWHNVARDPRLWNTLEFKGAQSERKVNTDVACNLLRRCPNLKTLTLDNVEDPITVIRQMCRCNNTIKHVEIRNCKSETSEKIPESVLRNIIHSCCSLESLNLKGTQFSAPRFYQELVNLPRLRKLNLSENKYLRIQDLMTIALNCRSLQDITVTRPQNGASALEITDQDAVFFFKRLSKTLKRVKFDTMGLGTHTFQAILSCPHLEKLSLHNALFLTGNVLREYAGNFRNLKQLRLTQACQLVSNDFIFLGETGILNNLTLLDLCGCWKICDKGLRSILQCCKDRLTYLGLKACKSIRDMQFIFDNGSTLEYLNIAHAFSPESRSMLSIPLKLPKLRKLVFDEHNVSIKLLKSLHEKMPYLMLIRSSSEFYKDETPIDIDEYTLNAA